MSLILQLFSSLSGNGFKTRRVRPEDRPVKERAIVHQLLLRSVGGVLTFWNAKDSELLFSQSFVKKGVSELFSSFIPDLRKLRTENIKAVLVGRAVKAAQRTTLSFMYRVFTGRDTPGRV